MTEIAGIDMEEAILLAEYAAIDLNDLDFDVARHAEGLRAFGRLALEPISIKPALRARDLALVRFPESKFLIGITDNAAQQEQAEQEKGSVGFAVIHTPREANRATEEAETVRHEVERYFLRHFPGRTLPAPPSATTAASTSPNSPLVFITLFPA